MQSGSLPIEVSDEEAYVPHRVLIIEDDPELGDLVALHLHDAGYITQVERHGRTGLAGDEAVWAAYGITSLGHGFVQAIAGVVLWHVGRRLARNERSG